MSNKRLATILVAVGLAAILGVGAAAWVSRPAGGTNEHVLQAELVPVDPSESGELPVLFPAPAFSMIDQDGNPVTAESLRGRPWIVDFIFTTCAGPCPMMTQKMSQLQKEIEDPRVRLVSFSVDPTRDRPKVLKEYSQKFGADPNRWSFLTVPEGGNMGSVYDVARGLKLAAGPATEDAPIFHSEKFLLIDADGNVRGIYSSRDQASLGKLAADATELAASAVAARATAPVAAAAAGGEVR